MQEENQMDSSEKIMHKMLTNTCPRNLTSVVEQPYTTAGGQHSVGTYGTRCGMGMAFIRRKGNSYYLVHNVRRGGKVRQLYLARLGERARITDAVVREVTKKHPFVELNWRSLREQLNNQMDLTNPQSPAVQKLVQSLRNLNLDLADLFPPVLQLSESPAVAQELLVQLRLLNSTIQVKLEQFKQRNELKRFARLSGRLGNAHLSLRGR
jgi:hypothetical protein